MVIFNLAKDEDAKVKNLESDRLADKENLKRKTNVETDLIEDDATLDGNVAPKAKSKKLNVLNPENFSGAETNVFRPKFEYPPSKDEKEKKQQNKQRRDTVSRQKHRHRRNVMSYRFKSLLKQFSLL